MIKHSKTIIESTYPIMPALPSPNRPSNDVPSRVLILYASQTGQAESISEYIYSKFQAGPLSCVSKYLSSLQPNNEQAVERICVSKFEERKEFFELDSQILREDTRYLLITVASTTGQGDPPDTALKFYRYLKKLQRTVKNLSKDGVLPFLHIRFALLGLGDTNYDNFAQFSKNLNRVFQELGAECLVETKYADDAGELETVTEPFIEHLTETITNLYSKYCSPLNSCVSSSITESDLSTTTMASTIELESSLKSLQISTPTENEIKLEKHECSYLDSEEFVNLNKQFLSLRGPFTEGDAKEYRKMPVQQFNPEDNPILGDSKTASLLGFFQNRHTGTVVYEAYAEADPQKVLTETSSKCLHEEKLDFKVNIHIRMSPEQMDNEEPFIPGASCGVYCMNSLNDILTICEHSTLNLSTDGNVQETLLLELLKQSEKVGLKSHNELYEIFEFLSFCVDSRSVIKRRDLYLLSQFASNPEDSNALKELSTRKTNGLYESVILRNHVTVCDILRLFPSIKINVYRLISILNPSKARFFSLSDCPVFDKDNKTQTVEIWATLSNNFVPLNGRNDENILGQFSGKFFLNNIFTSNDNIFEQIKANSSALPTFNCCERNFSKFVTKRIPIFFFRRISAFKISPDFRTPSLFLSAGTGLSPFLSFFQARQRYSKNSPESEPAKMLLFHGTRNEHLVIEKDRLAHCFSSPNDSLLFAFSRQKTDTVADKALESACTLSFGRVPDSLKCNCNIVLDFLKSASRSSQNDKKMTDDCQTEQQQQQQTQVLLPFSIYLCGGKAFQKDVTAALHEICDQSPELGANFWSETLLPSIMIDQW